MPILSKPSSAPKTSLVFITIGAILAIWSAVWQWKAPPASGTALNIICTGLFLTGLAFLVIGLSVGWIGRSARHAELPPPEATEAVARAEQIAAASRGAAAPAAPPTAAVNPGVAAAAQSAQNRK